MVVKMVNIQLVRVPSPFLNASRGKYVHMLLPKLILICFSQLTLTNSRNVQQKERQCHVCWFALFPAKIREISRPRLNAWLNKMRDWKVETKGNHEKNTIGTKMAAPIPASYIRAISRTESHSPTVLSGLFHVMASCVMTSY
jgi:hypothetical protein